MAKELKISNAKVEIDGRDGHKAHKWTLITGINEAEIIISCHDLEAAPKLSVEENPNPEILLVELCGVELRYSTKLVKVERTPFEDGIDQIEYFFEIVGASKR